MKLRWFKLLPFLLSTLFLFSTLFIISCDSDDDDEEISCRLSTLKSSYDEITDTGTITHTGIQEYVYNAEHKIEAILIHGDESETRANLEYNAKGQLTKIVAYDLSTPEKIDNTYEVIYDDHDKPFEIREWYADDDPSGPPATATIFTHDGNGRLIKREVSFGYKILLLYPERFEYNNDNNLTKMFVGDGTNEFLYLENLSFDNKSKYYALAPELEILYVYIFHYLPGRNNPLTARVHGTTTQEATDVTYNVTYDANGRITSCHTSPPTVAHHYLIPFSGSPDFDEVKYHCPL